MVGVRVVGGSCLPAIIVLLQACTSVDFKTPIEGFQTATGTAKELLIKQQTELDNAILDVALQAAAEDGAPLVAIRADECLQKKSTRCRLSIGPWPFNKGAIDHSILELSDGLTQYAAGLLEVAKAETASKVQSAVDAAKASALSIAGQIDTLNKLPANATTGLKAEITPYAAPVSGLVTFGLQKYLEQVKIRALRAAVNDMELVFDQYVEWFERLAEAAKKTRQSILTDNFTKAYDDYLAGRMDKAKLATLRKAADDLDAVLRGNPTDVFSNLRKAHGALADALNHRNLSFQQVFQYVQKVLDETAKFADLLKQLETAGDAGSKPG